MPSLKTYLKAIAVADYHAAPDHTGKCNLSFHVGETITLHMDTDRHGGIAVFDERNATIKATIKGQTGAVPAPGSGLYATEGGKARLLAKFVKEEEGEITAKAGSVVTLLNWARHEFNSSTGLLTLNISLGFAPSKASSVEHGAIVAKPLAGEKGAVTVTVPLQSADFLLFHK